LSSWFPSFFELTSWIASAAQRTWYYSQKFIPVQDLNWAQIRVS
jgi:hypothetical protein